MIHDPSIFLRMEDTFRTAAALDADDSAPKHPGGRRRSGSVSPIGGICAYPAHPIESGCQLTVHPTNRNSGKWSTS